MKSLYGVIASKQWVLASFMLSCTSLFATPRTPGDQVGVFNLEVTQPNPTKITFDFKVTNMTNQLSPRVPAPFINTTASVNTYSPSRTIPSPTPEVHPATVVPERFGSSSGTLAAVGAGQTISIMGLTSVHPDHVTFLIAQLTNNIDTRNQLLGQFDALALSAIWTIASTLSPIPLDWEDALTTVLDAYIPGADWVKTLLDLGITYAAMQNLSASLDVLKPQTARLAELAVTNAMDVWLPYGTAQLTGFIPEIPDPGIVAVLPVGPMGTVPSDKYSTINVVPDTGSTLPLLSLSTLTLVSFARRHSRKRAAQVVMQPDI